MKRRCSGPHIVLGILLVALLSSTLACKSMGNKGRFALPPEPLNRSGLAASLQATGPAMGSSLETAKANESLQPPLMCTGDSCTAVPLASQIDSNSPSVTSQSLDAAVPYGVQSASVNGQQSEEGSPIQAVYNDSPDLNQLEPPVVTAEGTSLVPQGPGSDGSHGQMAVDFASLSGPVVTPETQRYPVASQAVLDLPSLSNMQLLENASYESMQQSSAASQIGHVFRVYVQGVRPGRGAVKIALFTDPETFPTPQFATAAKTLADTEPQLVADFELSTPVPVAIAAFQDLDSNGSLTRGRAGIPVEPFAFSNNAPMRRGPPAFSEVAVSPSPETAGSPTMVILKLP